MSICKQVILKMTFSSTDWQIAGQSAIYKRSRGFRSGITENKSRSHIAFYSFVLLQRLWKGAEAATRMWIFVGRSGIQLFSTS